MHVVAQQFLEKMELAMNAIGKEEFLVRRRLHSERWLISQWRGRFAAQIGSAAHPDHEVVSSTQVGTDR